MLIHQLRRRAPEWHAANQELPKRYAKRVQVRADVNLDSSELFGTCELWGPSKGPRRSHRGIRGRFVQRRLRQTEVDNLRRSKSSIHHSDYDVGWFDVPVHEA